MNITELLKYWIYFKWGARGSTSSERIITEFFFKKCIFREAEKEIKGQSNLPFAGLFHTWLYWLGLGQGQKQESEILSKSPVFVAGTQVLEPHLLSLDVFTSQKLDCKWRQDWIVGSLCGVWTSIKWLNPLWYSTLNEFFVLLPCSFCFRTLDSVSKGSSFRMFRMFVFYNSSHWFILNF